ncbi:MAG: hypothetical protein GXP25_12310 [Planctomycetes bacterium]|nr:hypothetical protein [Planctomycetota bacterium]
MRHGWLGAVGILMMVNISAADDSIVLRGGDFALHLSTDGKIVRVEGPPGARSLLAEEMRPLFFIVVCGKKSYAPTAVRLDKPSHRLEFAYGDTGISATVEVESKPTHLRLTLLDVRGAEPDSVTILRLPVKINGTVGTVVGVIRDSETAVGVQGLSLNIRAGAAPGKWGGYLHAGVRANQGGIQGASIALFACPARKALKRIGEIELAEGLPHPILDGQWNKLSPSAHRPYLVIRYGVQNMDKVLALAKRGGFRYIYHPNPFKTWGHFVLDPKQFPEGDRSLRECADKAAKEGIGLGFHTLSGFITTNDAYVTPVPDPRLGRIGSATLAGDIDAAATEIPVSDATPFRKRQTLSAVIMGRELATYEGITEASPPRLTGVRRGAFGTTASAHAKGDDIGKLADHSYKTFFPGIANGMMDEMADRLIDLVNKCDIQMMSFDGLEGLASYEGGGEYSRNRFVERCHRGWNHHVISGASNLLHYTWHWHTRMNWGELTQSAKMDIDSYRAKNCDFYRANFLPAGMGWWRIGTTSFDWEATRLEDVEYLLAKAAGNNATHALSTDEGIVGRHGLAGHILDLVKTWDDARFGGAFTEAQLARLREKGKDFRLRRVKDEKWELIPIDYGPFYWYCAKGDGLTLASEGAPRPAQPFSVENPFDAQPLRFEVRCLPAYDYHHAENIDLTPEPEKLVREAGLHKEAPTIQVERDGEIHGQPALRLTTSYKGDKKPSFVTRLCCTLPKPIDLTKNRGLGLWVEGDGKGETLFVELYDGRMVRQYYVPMDFAGERYIELPLGEVSLKRFYDYEWNNWTGFSSWWWTLKGFRYQHVTMVTLGYNAIPPKTRVSCRVAGIKALRERPAKIRTIRFTVGEGQIEFHPDLEPFQYLICNGSGPAQVCDSNFHVLRAVEPSGGLRLPAGAAKIAMSCESDGSPWMRFQVNATGPVETVAAR